MRSFVQSLMLASEKAARIARACRKEKDLFQLLIQEKTGGDKNSKFVTDFKTLADVLIQETVRFDLEEQYPQLVNHIKGEESNKFTNTLGDTIAVTVMPEESETAALLTQVLDKNEKAGCLLAKHVHNDIEGTWLSAASQVDLSAIPTDGDFEPTLFKENMDDLGIWIDPIDSTNSYIKASQSSSKSNRGDLDFCSNGLQVVTVLIGVYSRRTGEPILGVINQPFAKFVPEEDKWRGEIYWGLDYKSRKFHSSNVGSSGSNGAESRDSERRLKMVVGFTELSCCQKSLSKTKMDVIAASGAGYKFLSVAKGWADFYLTTRPNTYMWDSCAGHAIIKSVNGECVESVTLNDEDETKAKPLGYSNPVKGKSGVDAWANANGVLAYVQSDLFESQLPILKSGLADLELIKKREKQQALGL